MGGDSGLRACPHILRAAAEFGRDTRLHPSMDGDSVDDAFIEREMNRMPGFNCRT